ncbi:MAG: hypothetical protein ACE37E_00485 [Hyphomicrobiales bacterium]
MDQHAFENYLDTHSQEERTKPLGRMVKNAFGMQEKVVLPKSYWQYVMWLEDQYGYDLESYFIQCDEERTDWTLSETIMYWLHRDMTERQAKGEPLPDPEELDRTYI